MTPQPVDATFHLHPEPKIITFDCYGTLVQWNEVLLAEITATLLSADAKNISAGDVLDSFSSEIERLAEQKPHQLFKGILRKALTAAFAEHGLTSSTSDIERIASSPMTMGPHEEVPDVLERLRNRYKLAIFTNSDDDLIAPTVDHIGVPFDYVITAEQAGAYKPSRQFFEYGYNKMEVRPNQTVHVAMGMYTDMKARHELGLRGIWVNRRRETGNPEWLPYTEVGDLEGAAALLLKAR